MGSPVAGALGDVGRSNSALRAFLHGLPGIDQIGAQERAAALAGRSVPGLPKRQAIDLAIAMVDLTTLEGADTPDKVRSLCAKAQWPDVLGSAGGAAGQAGGGAGDVTGRADGQPGNQPCPAVAAVCVYPSMVPVAAAELVHSPVRVASVATAFPSGQSPLAVRLAEVTAAVEAGADEIDMVINRGAFLAGRYLTVFEEIQEVRRACGTAHLKVILETGELATYDNVRRASWLAMLAGADFIKTSTGKVQPAATPPVTLIMLEAVRDFHAATGRRVGVKPAGGIRTTKDAIKYLALVNASVGEQWLNPELFRFGASGLLTDLLMQRAKTHTGYYFGPDYFTVD